jgi:hypothetical protein
MQAEPTRLDKGQADLHTMWAILQCLSHRLGVSQHTDLEHLSRVALRWTVNVYSTKRSCFACQLLQHVVIAACACTVSVNNRLTFRCNDHQIKLMVRELQKQGRGVGNSCIWRRTCCYIIESWSVFATDCVMPHSTFDRIDGWSQQKDIWIELLDKCTYSISNKDLSFKTSDTRVKLDIIKNILLWKRNTMW